jgi:MscS family membrane protein
MAFINSFIGQVVVAILIISAFIFLRRYVRRFLFSFLEKVVARTTTKIDDEILKVLKKPFELFFLTAGAQIAIQFVELEAKFAVFLNNILMSIFTIALFWAIHALVRPASNVILISSSKLSGKDLGKDLANLITKFVQIIIIALGIITILQEWGYNITGFLASLGLVGMAIALAAKDTVANLFGSLVIFSDKPFRIGDWIKTSNVEGTVEAVGIRSTKVRTFAQALVSVPNATLANTEILNWSRMGKRRIKMSLGLTYSTSTAQMEKIVQEIRELLKNDVNIHQETIHVYFTDFHDSSLGIFCYFFTKTTNWAQYMEVREDINLKLMKIVENNGSSFAFPTQSIFIENDTQIN